jgi:hypothetical protein
MKVDYDAFYTQHQRPVTFSECALGQVLAVEGALEPVVWQPEWDEWAIRSECEELSEGESRTLSPHVKWFRESERPPCRKGAVRPSLPRRASMR